jgi:hypothetical protein
MDRNFSAYDLSDSIISGFMLQLESKDSPAVLIWRHHYQIKKDKNKFGARSDHEGPEKEHNYSSTLF